MSKDLEWVKRLDVLVLALRQKRIDFKPELICGACGRRTVCLTDGEGHNVCRDCWTPKDARFCCPPKRVPQGDLLVRLPLSPRFTKKFS